VSARSDVGLRCSIDVARELATPAAEVAAGVIVIVIDNDVIVDVKNNGFPANSHGVGDEIDAHVFVDLVEDCTDSGFQEGGLVRGEWLAEIDSN